MSRASSPWRRVAAPSIRFVPWAALASCWPLPQQLLPVSAAGGGRSCCVAGWVESRGREGGVGTPLPASGPAERPCPLLAGRKLPRGARRIPNRPHLPVELQSARFRQFRPLRRSRARFPFLSPTVTSSPGAGEVFPQGGSQAVKFITKVLGAMRKFLAVLLALPLGELSPQVTERAQQG